MPLYIPAPFSQQPVTCHNYPSCRNDMFGLAKTHIIVLLRSLTNPQPEKSTSYQLSCLAFLPMNMFLTFLGQFIRIPIKELMASFVPLLFQSLCILLSFLLTPARTNCIIFAPINVSVYPSFKIHSPGSSQLRSQPSPTAPVALSGHIRVIPQINLSIIQPKECKPWQRTGFGVQLGRELWPTQTILVGDAKCQGMN